MSSKCSNNAQEDGEYAFLLNFLLFITFQHTKNRYTSLFLIFQEEIDDYGIDWDGPLVDQAELDHSVDVPELPHC
jgi:hypothetical protein